MALSSFKKPDPQLKNSLILLTTIKTIASYYDQKYRDKP